MKKLLFFLCLLLFGCSDNTDPVIEDIKLVPPELIGKWKITEKYGSESGLNPTWGTYNSGNEYHVWFKNNFRYEKIDGDPVCLTGTFSISGNKLKYTTDNCGEKEVLIELLNENNLIIDFQIFEPVKAKYIKISSEGK